MARRLLCALTLACAGLALPSTAAAATELSRSHAGSEPATGKQALTLAKQIRSGEGVTTGHELTPVLKVLAEKLPELKGADRRSAERVLARPTQTEGNPGEATYSVPEATPVCSTHYCVHYVTTTADAPPGGISYVNSMLSEFENVYNVENVQLGWKPPISDGTRGGDSRTDVYIKNIGPDGLYGYSAPDPGQSGRQVAAFLVMDNDYAEPAFTSRYSSFLPPLQVTAAHEYNHVLHFAYDLNQDSWMFEATATWMEDRVYDDIDDYRGYLDEWAKRSVQPLTQFNPPESGDSNSKVYGDAVFNRWIDQRFGPETIRRAWEVSIETKDFAPAAYDQALRETGSSFFDVFTQFAADTAEWRSANTAFEEGGTYPDMVRALGGDTIAPQSKTGDKTDFIEGGLDHTAFALLNVNPSGENNLTAGGTLPRGVAGAIALVGRTGGDTSGSSVVQLTRLPNGGPGKVTLPNATSFTRVTAVVINSDIDVGGYSDQLGDWTWVADGAPITVALNDFTTAKLSSVKAGKTIKLKFNEAPAGITSSSVKVTGPGGKKVRFAISISGRNVTLRPTRKLSRGRRYTVKLSSGVTDPGGNPVASSSRTKRFTAR